MVFIDGVWVIFIDVNYCLGLVMIFFELFNGEVRFYDDYVLSYFYLSFFKNLCEVE